MTKFRIGDHVRIIASPSSYFDSAGTVTRIAPVTRWPFCVECLDGELLWFGPNELILAEHQMEEAT